MVLLHQLLWTGIFLQQTDLVAAQPADVLGKDVKPAGLEAD